MNTKTDTGASLQNVHGMEKRPTVVHSKALLMFRPQLVVMKCLCSDCDV